MKRQDPPPPEGRDAVGRRWVDVQPTESSGSATSANRLEPAGSEDGASEDPGTGWMLQFRDGDEAAFDKIITEYQSSVYYFIFRTVNDTGRAEDLTQEVFVRLYKARRRYRPTAKFRTYLFTIANRLSLNELRARTRRQRVFVSLTGRNKDSHQGAGETLESYAVAEGEAPGDRLERQELEQIINNRIEKLPTNQQAAIRLQRSEHFSYEEIAQILKVSSGAVKSLLVRAREALREEVERYLHGAPKGMDERS